MNDLARERLQEEGLLTSEEVIATARGARAFAAGDRVLFLRNERSLGVKNGTLGTVERVEGQQLQVRLDGQGSRRVSFHARDYDQLEHGYATTIHKAQGTTVDYSYLLLTGHLDRHGSYVALSRHRQGVAAYYGGDEFADLAALARRLGRDGSKGMALPAAGEDAAVSRRGGLRAVLRKVGAMARGTVRQQASSEPTHAAGQPAAGSGTRLEQQLARAREAAAQLRQRQATQRDMAAAQGGGTAGASRPAAGSGTRLEQQLARAKEAVAQLRQQRAAQREVPAHQDSAGAGAPSGVAETRLAQQLARAREAAAQIRQEQAARREAATRQESVSRVAEPDSGAAATRLEQQVARGREIAAELRQRRTVQRDATARAPSQQAGTTQQTTRLAQQLAIARRVAARLRQRSRERDHGLEL